MLSWLFVFLVKKSIVVKYLIIQSIFLLISLLIVYYAPWLLLFSFILKIRLPPIHIWGLNFIPFLGTDIFIFITTLHKLVPVLIFSRLVLTISQIGLMTLLVLLSVVLIYQSSGVITILFYSSRVNTLLISLSRTLGVIFLVQYWFIYSSLLTAVLTSLFRKYKLIILKQNYLRGGLWLTLAGLPPFSIFFIKVSIILSLIKISFIIRSLIILRAVIVLRSYYLVTHSIIRTISFNKETKIFILLSRVSFVFLI